LQLARLALRAAHDRRAAARTETAAWRSAATATALVPAGGEKQRRDA
jgi:hypothetical protein